MKIKCNKELSLNACLGVNDITYCSTSEDIKALIFDRYVEKGKCDHVAIAKYLMEEIRHKHLGETNEDFSEYEAELFVGGMIMRFMLLPSVQKGIQSAAYVKQMSDGLNDI